MRCARSRTRPPSKFLYGTAIFFRRPLTLTDREAGICKTYRDIGGDPDPFTAGVIAGCTLATSDRACDDGFGFGYLDASRRGATNLCKSGGTASFTSHPDAGHCGGAEPAHVLDLRNVVRVSIQFTQRTVPPSARSSTRALDSTIRWCCF